MSKYNYELNLNEDNSLTKIIKMIKPNSKILEFGPAYGRLTKHLKEQMTCEIDIIEIDEESGNKAKEYANKSFIGSDTGNIEEYIWYQQLQNEKYDYIIFADVLEHLYRPEQVLHKCEKLLTEEGSILISVPNIAHNDIIINLYYNNFNYTPIGLLDDSHIHFFALNTLFNLARSTGYQIVHLDGVTSVTGSTEQGFDSAVVRRDLLKLISEKSFGNVYQFVCKLQKIDYVEKNLVLLDSLLSYNSSGLVCNFYFEPMSGLSVPACIRINHNTNVFATKIDIPENAKYIRFDPTERCCKIKIVDFESNIKDIEFIALNSLYNHDGFDVFADEPIYLINNKTIHPIEHVEIFWKQEDLLAQDFLELLHVQNKKSNLELMEKDIIINKQHEQALEYDRQFKKKDEDILALSLRIRELEEHLKKISQSK